MGILKDIKRSTWVFVSLMLTHYFDCLDKVTPYHGSSGTGNILFNMVLSFLALVHSYKFLWEMCRLRRHQIYLAVLPLPLCRVRNI